MPDVEDELAEVPRRWWREQARTKGGTLSGEQVVALAPKFVEVGGGNIADAIRVAQESGVIADVEPLEVITTPEVVVEEVKGPNPGAQEPPIQLEEKEKPMETITEVVRANMHLERPDIEKILRTKKIPFTKNSVYSIKSQIRKQSGLTPTSGGKRKQVISGRTKAVVEAALAVAPPKTPTTAGPGSKLDRAIKELEGVKKELEAKIIEVDGKLGALVTARDVLKSF